MSEEKEITKEEGETSKEEAPLFQKKKEKFVWNWKSFLMSFLWLPILLIAIDQISKWAVVNALKDVPGRSLEVIPHFFYITLTFNKGSSFGMGGDVSWMRYVFIVISWLASGLILFYWIKNLSKKDTFIDVLLAFCLAGAIGNGIDRTFYWEGTTGFSGVVDFFQFYIFGYGEGKSSFAIFNVADMYLTCAVAVLIVLLLVREIKASKKEGKN